MEPPTCCLCSAVTVCCSEVTENKRDRQRISQSHILLPQFVTLMSDDRSPTDVRDSEPVVKKCRINTIINLDLLKSVNFFLISSSKFEEKRLCRVK